MPCSAVVAGSGADVAGVAADGPSAMLAVGPTVSAWASRDEVQFGCASPSARAPERDLPQLVRREVASVGVTRLHGEEQARRATGGAASPRARARTSCTRALERCDPRVGHREV